MKGVDVVFCTSDVESAWDACTPRQRLARLLLIRSAFNESGSPDDQTLELAREGVGSFHGPPMLEYPQFCGPRAALRFNERLRSAALDAVGFAPLIGANAERGLSYTTRTGGTDVPYPAMLGLGDPPLSEKVGIVVGSEFRAAGYGWVFQPVADVRTTADDPVIGVRAYGSDPAAVAEHVAAYVRGLQSQGILAVGKHFPGHGDARVDSHLGLPVVKRTEQEQQEIHLVPFRALIEAGAGALMTAHVSLPGLGVQEIATFSEAVCRGLLRGELGFQGLLVTDALRMAAVAQRYGYAEAFIASLRAGCDVMNIRCWPPEVPLLLDQLEDALAQGVIDETHLYGAFMRVVHAQSRVPAPSGPIPPEETQAWTNRELRSLVRTHDPDRQLPLNCDGELGIVVQAPVGRDVPPITLMESIGSVTGLPTRRVQAGESLDGIGALLVVCYSQAGISNLEWEGIRFAEASGISSACLLAGPTPDVEGIPLPTVATPTVDVFGLASLAGLKPALADLVTSAHGRRG